MKTLIIINPHAGLLNPRAAGAGEVEYLARRVLPGAEVVVTRSEEHAREVVVEALERGVEIIAGAGGDGTAHFLAGLLAGKSAAMGIIPLGSAGNVARSLGIPQSPGRALAALGRGRQRALDLGYANGEHFIEAAGIGFHADVLKRYALKERKGFFRGAFALGKSLLENKPFTAEIESDGRISRRRVVQITVANLPLYGTGFEIAPGAEADDGLLDVTVLGEPSAAVIPLLAASAGMGLIRNFPGVSHFRTARLTIRTETPLAVHADAGIAGETPAEFYAVRSALNIIVK